MKTLNQIKIIGTSLMVGGLLLAIYGYGLYANVMCNCPIFVPNCHCGEEQESIGHFTIYTGIAIALGGLGFAVYFGRRYRSPILDG